MKILKCSFFVQKVFTNNSNCDILLHVAGQQRVMRSHDCSRLRWLRQIFRHKVGGKNYEKESISSSNGSDDDICNGSCMRLYSSRDNS